MCGRNAGAIPSAGCLFEVEAGTTNATAEMDLMPGKRGLGDRRVEPASNTTVDPPLEYRLQPPAIVLPLDGHGLPAGVPPLVKPKASKAESLRVTT